MPDGRSLSHQTLEELRINAVKRVLAGESPEVVIKAIGFSRPRIYEWLALYEKEGFEGLKAKKIPGRPPKLTDEQSSEIKSIILNSTPEEYGFKYALWTLQIISQLIIKLYAIKISKSAMCNIMHKWGLSSQKPTNKSYQQDPEQVKAWKEKVFPEIKKQAKKEKAEIFFGDESSIRSDHYKGKTWGEKGKTPIVIRKWSRHKINMLSAISPLGNLRFMLTSETVTSKTFLTFLKRLIRGVDSKIYLITDGHPIHKTKLIKDFLLKNKDRIELFIQPPYSPELNPDELVWNEVKSNDIGRKRIDDISELKSAIYNKLFTLQRTPEKVIGFFKKDTTEYILEAAL